MRALPLLALPLLATSCTGSRWDGTYQVLTTFLSWNCSADTVLVPEGYHSQESGMLEVRHTAADSLIVSLDSLLLAGTHDGSEFEVSTSQGFTDSSCEQYTYNLGYVFDGSFTGDLGIEGTLTITEAEVREGCAAGDDANETCTMSWGISGFLIENHEDQHDESPHWGYTPQSSY